MYKRSALVHHRSYKRDPEWLRLPRVGLSGRLVRGRRRRGRGLLRGRGRADHLDLCGCRRRLMEQLAVSGPRFERRRFLYCGARGGPERTQLLEPTLVHITADGITLTNATADAPVEVYAAPADIRSLVDAADELALDGGGAFAVRAAASASTRRARDCRLSLAAQATSASRRAPGGRRR